MRDFIDIVFTRPPGPDSDFVESEDQDGHGIRAGQWIYDGRFWRLRIEPASFHEDYVPDTNGLMVNAIHATAISLGTIITTNIDTGVIMGGKRRKASPHPNDTWILLAVAIAIVLFLVAAGVAAHG